MRIGLPSRMRPRAAEGALEPRLAWILGSPRSGSTWLLNLLACSRQIVPVDEPGIGVHLGTLVAEAAGPRALGPDADHLVFKDLRADDPDYFFSSRHEDSWRPALRRLILERLSAQLGAEVLETGGFAVLKEPNGSQAADMIFRALPRARLIFLLRDGRDVVDSHLDLLRTGAWGTIGEQQVADYDRIGFLEGRARVWLRRTEVVQDVYRSLPTGNRLLVRYEDLLADTRAVLTRLFEWLGLEVSEDRISSRVAELSYDALPAESRGPGKFARAASPGLWRENLTAAEQAAVERVIGPKLEELGYEPAEPGARRP